MLFYIHYRRIPGEQIEAARVDGARALQAWWWGALPQARPAAQVVATLSFLAYWNDFLQPLLYLRSQRLYTLAVGLQQLQQMDRTNWPLMLAAAVVMSLPVILLFLLVQRYFFQDGLTK